MPLTPGHTHPLLIATHALSFVLRTLYPRLCASKPAKACAHGSGLSSEGPSVRFTAFIPGRVIAAWAHLLASSSERARWALQRLRPERGTSQRLRAAKHSSSSLEHRKKTKREPHFWLSPSRSSRRSRSSRSKSRSRSRSRSSSRSRNSSRSRSRSRNSSRR